MKWVARAIKGLLLVLVILICAGFALVAYLDPFWGTSFSPEGWKEAGNCQGLSDWKCVEKAMRCPRGAMVFSLTWFHLARGRTTKQEVVEMLGEGDARGDGRACLTYSLGMCSGLGVDYDDLLVCFDDDNKFERTKRRQG